ncbi:hypothetical protein [Schleiferilactobacillus harbinensis]|uniref:Uncharacterized protein n=1 Tax=Schleiferilactobacillus harbinensis TaxID=304207 RepID=A0A5P8M6J4_9LACO|nr:hypothetical protein [Schleiferilactobacillus harbinensis]QFR23721.1 hypothetical protein D1010_10055 [Schleiferilactobacillus harbinensis]
MDKPIMLHLMAMMIPETCDQNPNANAAKVAKIFSTRLHAIGFEDSDVSIDEATQAMIDVGFAVRESRYSAERNYFNASLRSFNDLLLQFPKLAAN